MDLNAVVRAGEAATSAELFDLRQEERSARDVLARTNVVAPVDGIIMDLLAAEIRAVTGKDPSEHYRELTARYGAPVYARKDVAATPEQKAVLAKLSPEQIGVRELAGDAVVQAITKAPSNGASLGGVKVSTARGWFAARPSGTENVYKVYAESFVDEAHLARIQTDAEAIVAAALKTAGL